MPWGAVVAVTGRWWWWWWWWWWCVLCREGGVVILTLYQTWNAHRLYGRLRLRLMFRGWRLLASYGVDHAVLANVDAKHSPPPSPSQPVVSRSRRVTGQPLFVLEKQDEVSLTKSHRPRRVYVPCLTRLCRGSPTRPCCPPRAGPHRRCNFSKHSRTFAMLCLATRNFWRLSRIGHCR